MVRELEGVFSKARRDLGTHDPGDALLSRYAHQNPNETQRSILLYAAIGDTGALSKLRDFGIVASPETNAKAYADYIRNDNIALEELTFGYDVGLFQGVPKTKPFEDFAKEKMSYFMVARDYDHVKKIQTLMDIDPEDKDLQSAYFAAGSDGDKDAMIKIQSTFGTKPSEDTLKWIYHNHQIDDESGYKIVGYSDFAKGLMEETGVYPEFYQNN